MLEVIDQPGIQVVDLAQAKVHLRVDSTIEDTYIGGLISATTQTIENYLDQSLIFRTLRYQRKINDSGFIEIQLPNGPIHEIKSIYAVTLGRKVEIKRFCCSKEGLLEIFLPSAMTLEVNYIAGFGAYPKNIPDVIKHAVLITITEMYEKRDFTSIKYCSSLKNLLNTYISRRLL